MKLDSLPILEDRRHYVYAHAKSTTGEIFYIGKGVGKRAKDLNRRSDWHHKVVAKHGCDVHVLEKHMTAKEAFAREIKLISEGREIGLELVNLSGGGEGVLGVSPSVEIRDKIRKKLKGIKVSDEAMSNRAKARIGKPLSDETRFKLGAAWRGRTHTEETRSKLSVINKGHVVSEETKHILRTKNLGKKASEETKAKLREVAARRTPEEWKSRASKIAGQWKHSDASKSAIGLKHKGKIITEETRQKMCLAAKARWDKRKNENH